MVFKRRDKRTWPRAIWEAIYPKGGWARAFHYVKHRVRRLPDSPERIARGIFVGVFVSFSPLFGLHFIVALLLAKLMNGNLFAAVLSTFFGNPLTFVPIAYVSMKTGHWLTGNGADPERIKHGFGEMFAGAGRDLWANLKALYTGQYADWAGLIEFYDDVFFPYLIGGIVPGIVSGLICYYLSVPVIRAYQKRRNKGVLKKRLNSLKQKAAERADKKAPEKG